MRGHRSCSRSKTAVTGHIESVYARHRQGNRHEDAKFRQTLVQLTDPSHPPLAVPGHNNPAAGLSNPTLENFVPLRCNVELSGARSDHLWIKFGAPSYRQTANEPDIDPEALQRPLDLCGVCSHQADGQKHVCNPNPSALPASPYWSSVTLKSPNEHQHALSGPTEGGDGRVGGASARFIPSQAAVKLKIGPELYSGVLDL